MVLYAMGNVPFVETLYIMIWYMVLGRGQLIDAIGNVGVNSSTPTSIHIPEALFEWVTEQSIKPVECSNTM